jgi:hypothetical protein
MTPGTGYLVRLHSGSETFSTTFFDYHLLLFLEGIRTPIHLCSRALPNVRLYWSGNSIALF